MAKVLGINEVVKELGLPLAESKKALLSYKEKNGMQKHPKFSVDVYKEVFKLGDDQVNKLNTYISNKPKTKPTAIAAASDETLDTMFKELKKQKDIITALEKKLTEAKLKLKKLKSAFSAEI